METNHSYIMDIKERYDINSKITEFYRMNNLTRYERLFKKLLFDFSKFFDSKVSIMERMKDDWLLTKYPKVQFYDKNNMPCDGSGRRLVQFRLGPEEVWNELKTDVCSILDISEDIFESYFRSKIYDSRVVITRYRYYEEVG